MNAETKKQLQELCEKFPVEFQAFYTEWVRDWQFLEWINELIEDDVVKKEDVDLVVQWVTEETKAPKNENQVLYHALYDLHLKEPTDEEVREWAKNYGGAGEILQHVYSIYDDVRDIRADQIIAVGLAYMIMKRWINIGEN